MWGLSQSLDLMQTWRTFAVIIVITTVESNSSHPSIHSVIHSFGQPFAWQIFFELFSENWGGGRQAQGWTRLHSALEGLHSLFPVGWGRWTHKQAMPADWDQRCHSGLGKGPGASGVKRPYKAPEHPYHQAAQIGAMIWLSTKGNIILEKKNPILSILWCDQKAI